MMQSQYEDFMRHVLEHGKIKADRTGTGTRSVFGYQMRFDLSQGFPLVTTKKVHFKSVVAELLWFLSGSTNVEALQAMGCTIWDEWAREDGSLGPIYGEQWRNWPGHDGWNIDQIAELIEGIRTNPHSRRHIVSAWNPADIPDMALAPCHALFQFDVRDMTRQERCGWLERVRGIDMDGSGEAEFRHHVCDQLLAPRAMLSCQLYQRSADVFLGVPFNIASYALLTHMVAQQCGLAVGDFIWTGGDCHIYDNHVEQVALQLSREPRPYPSLHIKRHPDSIFGYKPEDFEVDDYNPHPAIKAPVAV